MRPKTSLLLLVAVLSQCAGAQQRATPQPIQIAAAADLEPVLPKVISSFEAKAGIQAQATYKSSAVLTQQILNGSPVDVFMAADTSYPERLIARRLAVEASPMVYARGALVLWARKGAPVLHGLPLSFAVLRSPALASVAVANPREAPYGRAAQEAIANMHLTQYLTPKLRVAANIAQAAQFADSGNAQVGFLSLTSARTERLEADGTFLPVPPETYAPLLQGAIVLRHAPHRGAALEFLQFLQTPEAKALLQQGGLEPPR